MPAYVADAYGLGASEVARLGAGWDESHWKRLAPVEHLNDPAVE